MVYKYLCVLLVLSYTEMLFIERKLGGDVITGISFDDCAEDNTKKWINEKCVCITGYETAIVIKGIIQCKNRSDILNFFDSSDCTIFGHNTYETRIVAVRNTSDFFLNDKQNKVLKHCKSINSGIDLIYPEKKEIPANWTLFNSKDSPPLITITNWNKEKYAGYLFRLNNVCKGMCVVAKFDEEVEISRTTKQSTTTTKTSLTTQKTSVKTAVSTTTNITSARSEENSSSIDIPLLVGIIIAALILILVVLGIVITTRRYRKTKDRKKHKPQPMEMGNPEYEYVSSTAANVIMSSDTTNQTASHVYERPIIKDKPHQRPSEPVYFETEPEYHDATYAQEKLEEYQATKRPVYAEINKNI
ncbi:uncharacterized protein LOC130649397 [Hydractinia symbiolongicarpus]|uniref:uncharacterized protein LOC130649397 n=1 Tax=Hydractinia symbiolongicarpus TaxID=13093 RepID=UPI00254C95DA|nr:uncharacterized protein LOC130649397 [Hydractinia symbiolongicarpus]